MLSIATSIDALAVGFSLSVIGVSIWFPAFIIGLVAGTLTVIGMLVGRRIGDRWGPRVEIFGGVVLIMIGASKDFVRAPAGLKLSDCAHFCKKRDFHIRTIVKLKIKVLLAESHYLQNQIKTNRGNR